MLCWWEKLLLKYRLAVWFAYSVLKKSFWSYNFFLKFFSFFWCWTFSVRLKKLVRLLSWCLKWLCGVCFTPGEMRSLGDVRSDPCVCVSGRALRGRGEFRVPVRLLGLARSLSTAAEEGAESVLTLLLLPWWAVCSPCAFPLGKECCSSFVPESSDNVLCTATVPAGASGAVYPL